MKYNCAQTSFQQTDKHILNVENLIVNTHFILQAEFINLMA